MKNLVLFLTLAVGTTGCLSRTTITQLSEPSQQALSENPGGPAANSPAPGLPMGEELNTIVVGKGMRDYRQMYENFAVATGVPASTATTLTVYNAVQVSMNENNAITQFSGTGLIAAVKLASEFCNSMITSTTSARAALFPGVAFGTETLTTFNDLKRQAAISAILKRTLSTRTPPDEMARMMLQASYDIQMGLANTNASFNALAISLCTMGLVNAKALVI